MKRSTVLGIGAALAVVAIGSAYTFGVDGTLRLLEGIVRLFQDTSQGKWG